MHFNMKHTARGAWADRVKKLSKDLFALKTAHLFSQSKETDMPVTIEFL